MTKCGREMLKPHTPGQKGFSIYKGPQTDGSPNCLKINVKNAHRREEGGTVEKGIKKIEKDLLLRHADDPIKLAKVHRYIRFLKIDLKCDADIDKDGTTIRIENGSQNFLKQHPARVGAIARKLGITWGGDWIGSIDRPLFEVKVNWSMPKGYKLEGQVIVPSNSKMKVQLIVEDKKEEVKVTNWNPGSPTMITEAEAFLTQAVKDGVIQKVHLNDLKNRTMTTDRLVGLYFTIQQRRNNK